eukprot:CAMPEP_0202768202 /NCGR_PEP_ID=MMETSP1388-20130828/34233_1 /ASSEMBLY_ACC=CAM_ASM_000864 /TAXON_ID=37098 /ORGANISM="Isochrysis sp, Strain CCMP1244" /LENGTH=58 /DNA_ID=CAMNT_0049436929 /DNA_START=250 /DNA_END=422 /DNA_ORIENTATION=+
MSASFIATSALPTTSNEASLTAAVLVAYGGSVSDKRKADCGSLLSSGLTAASRDWMAA